MPKLLMITGLGTARGLAQGKENALYVMLEEFHKYWGRIDIILPRVKNVPLESTLFGNVFLHVSPWPLIFHPIWFLKKAIKIHRKEKFDLITVHEFPPFYDGIGARILWYIIRVPYVIEVHHVPGYPRSGGFKESIYKIFSGLFIKFDTTKASAVRVVNQKETPGFLIEHGVPKEKIKYIPSMYIDLETFKPMDVEKKYDLIFTSRLEINKGIFNLIEAVTIAKHTKPNIKLLIIGDGSQKEALIEFVRKNNLDKNVVFSGWVETANDVAGAYNSAKCFINPSYNEGGPRVVLEAMACGLPVITTRVGLMHDIIQDGQNGLFTEWEPLDMAKKILMLLSNSEMQQRFSSAGIDIAKQFDKKSQIKNYAKRLKELL